MEIESFVHKYCFFYKDGNLTAGWVEGTQKNKLLLAPIHGKVQILAPNRISTFWKSTGAALTKEKALDRLSQQVEQIQELSKSHELELIHELCEPGSNYTLENLTEDFLDEPEDALHRMGLFYALEHDRHFFKRKNNAYIPRSPEELKQLEIQEQREQERLLQEEKTKQWMQAIESGNWDASTEIDQDQEQWLQQIRSVLIYGKDSGYWKNIAPLFRLNATPNEEDDAKIRKILDQVGHPISWGRLLLSRAAVRFDFEQARLDAATEQSQAALQKEGRKSWPDVPTFTIDSAKTEDYDDAFSILGWAENRIEIAVHIADLSEIAHPKSVWFEEAEKRVSSVYTLKEIYPMLPPALSNGFFSLKEGEERAVVSYIFHLFRNGEAKLQGIEFGLIEVENNLTYDQVDEWVENNESFWGTLSMCCQALRQKRIEHGALVFDRKEVDLNISDPDNIQIIPVNRNSMANQMVEEMAVLVNQEVGTFFNDKDCPGIFRTQAPYEIVKEVAEGEQLTPAHLSIEPARLSTQPGGHAGLGCEYYMQATSPIRRFVDLISQCQLGHYLRHGSTIFEEEQLMEWAEKIQEIQKTYSRAERELQSHWKAKYLTQHYDEVFTATVRRHMRSGRSELIFEDIQYMAQVSGFSQYDVGASLEFRVENVDVDRHFVVGTLQASPSETTEEPESDTDNEVAEASA